MNVIDRLRHVLLRWDRLLAAGAVLLPFAALLVFGFLWLVGQGWLLPFIGLSAAGGALVLLVRTLVRRRGREDAAAAREAYGVAADPDWLPREKAAFEQACRRIEAETREPLPWESLPGRAFEVVEDVSRELAGEQSTLKVTPPEALLLIERTASRYRDYLRRHLPFSDQVSLATLQWLWRRRGQAGRLWKVARGGHRVARLALNPKAGILREVEQLVAGGNADYLSDQMLGVLQAVLLEEAAFAAVELYSGRLRFSDAELLQIQLAEAEADRERLARPDAPLRILFVGQVSAGKSTLINALLGEARAETDAAPTSDGLLAYPAALDEMPCHFLDSPGLDGSTTGRANLLEAVTRADLVVWVVRANRPAREPDRQLRHDVDAWFEARPERRKPPELVALTAVDTLVAGWPLANQHLPGPAQDTVARAVNSVAADLEHTQVIPVSAADGSWNLDALRSALAARLGEALLAQRNRTRVDAAHAGDGFLGEARKGARGVWRGTRSIGGRLVRRHWGDEP